MSVTAAIRAAVGSGAPTWPADVSWRYDPWRERPRVALLASLMALSLCLLVVSLREHLLWTLGLCLFCVASFSPALTPVECRLESSGVARRGLLGWERRPWAGLRRVVDLPSGVFVSPYPARHWLDAQRGLSLPMPAAERAALAAELRRRVAQHDA